METSLNVYDYPEPPEPKEKHIRVKVYITQEVDYYCPIAWNKDDIKQDIDDNINYFNWENIEIEDIEVKEIE